MDVAGKRVVVVGLARSGVAAARFLAARGARVLASERKPARELAAEALSLEGLGVELELGGHKSSSFERADLLVVSPGVGFDLPELQAARWRGVPVLAELELGYREMRGTVVAVTGTKGKSTTTAALGAMLREGGRGDVRVGGNIGAPVTGMLEGASEKTTFVLEVSSFQLEGTSEFHAQGAVFLNLSPDHLDRHPSLEAYAAAKALVFRNQSERDFAVVNADDPQVLGLARAGRARLLPFSPGRAAAAAPGDLAFFDGERAILRLSGESEVLFERRSLKLPGAHLASDLLAAGAAARLLGVSADAIARSAASFEGVEHVLERVTEIGGVLFVNDSKATNVAAARMSLEALGRPLVAVMGGRYKGGDFGELRDVARRRVRAVMAIGEARERIAQALADLVPVVSCASLREAVERAAARARPGDAVVLAPGCSSFDMFEDYAARGRAFKQEVRRLGGESVTADPGEDGRARTLDG